MMPPSSITGRWGSGPSQRRLGPISPAPSVESLCRYTASQTEARWFVPNTNNLSQLAFQLLRLAQPHRQLRPLSAASQWAIPGLSRYADGDTGLALRLPRLLARR